MKRKTSNNNIVYSTDSSYQFDSSQVQQNEHVSPADQRLKIKLDRKNRGGKVVTIIDGYAGSGAEDLSKSLKNYCGTGGAVKDGQIIIQGDNMEKIREWLTKKGYSKTT